MADSYDTPLKRCSACGETKPATTQYFYKHPSCKYGVYNVCKICSGQRRAAQHTANSLNGQKRCTKCGEWKPETLEYFYASKTQSSGLLPRCKTCLYEATKQHRANHPEQRHISDRKWYAEHREQESARKAKRHVEYHEEELATQAAYRDKNRDRVRKNHKAWSLVHREQVLARQSQYRSKYPQKSRAIVLRRRARIRALPNSFTDADATRALEYWQHQCVYCGKSLVQLHLFDDVKLNFDHFIPLADKREANPGTTVGNMLPSCRKCNLSKLDHDPIQWITNTFPQTAKAIIRRIATYFETVKES